MKATGIIRQIDDVGRVVIPKELRRVMEGLVMADIALTAFIHERVRPQD